MDWGLLGGDDVGKTRRTRTLGLAATIRAFNESAVPGIGGVWYGKQLVLALLGIHLAETMRRQGLASSNIGTSNAVEALSVWLSFVRHKWTRDERLPGYRKLRRLGVSNVPSFSVAADRSFYVTQPMRVRTVDALATFGFVEAPSRRFNAYSCRDEGLALLAAASPEARRTLLPWVGGGDLPVKRTTTINELDPTRPLPGAAREIVREALVGGSRHGVERRRHALNWVEALRDRPMGHADWAERPAEIAEEAHWADMRAGAAFARVIAAAAGRIEGGSVLSCVEAHMGAAGTRRVRISEAAGAHLKPALEELRLRAGAFLAAGHDPSPDRLASAFCQDCNQKDDALVLNRLVARDDRILRLDDRDVVAGPAFQGRPIDDETAEGASSEDDDVSGDAPDNATGRVIPPFPDGISVRIRNLYWLADDLRAVEGTVDQVA